MHPKPRFTLKAILGCMAALSVPFAVIAAGFPLAGAVVLISVTVGCIVFLNDGWKGVRQALVATGVILLIVAVWVSVLVIRLYLF